jgi:hypothetical protein
MDINYTSAEWDTNAGNLKVPENLENAQAVSLLVDTATDPIVRATLTPSATAGDGAIQYFLSNDNGLSFEEVTPGVQHSFAKKDTRLKWKVVLIGGGDGLSPTIDSLSISYETEIKGQVVHIDSTDHTHMAIQISHTIFADSSAQAVLLATNQNPIDSFVGIILAQVLKAPILLTDPGGLPPDTAAEIARVLAKSRPVIILGGTRAVSSTVEQQLKSHGWPTQRIAGKTRYDTAALIASDVAEHNGSYANKLYLTEAQALVDAFSISPVAAHQALGSPGAIILTPRGSSKLPAETVRILKARTGVSRVEVIGGPDSIPHTIIAQVQAILPSAVISRTAGADRYGTNIDVVTGYFNGPPSAVVVDGGATFSVANLFTPLLAGRLAAHLGAPLMLANYDRLDPEQSDFLLTNAEAVDAAYVVGSATHQTRLSEQLYNLVASEL